MPWRAHQAGHPLEVDDQPGVAKRLVHARPPVAATFRGPDGYVIPDLVGRRFEPAPPMWPGARTSPTSHEGRLAVSGLDAGPGVPPTLGLLDGRPRKTLGWKTPAEALDQLLGLAAQGSVAPDPP
jgi:hypothetical protein